MKDIYLDTQSRKWLIGEVILLRIERDKLKIITDDLYKKLELKQLKKTHFNPKTSSEANK